MKRPRTEGKGDRYHHGDLRRAVLDAALAMIEREGLASLSLREVARRAGVSHAAPYRHFDSRDALLAALAEEGFRELHARMLARVAALASDDPLDAFLEAGVAYVVFAVEKPSHFRAMFAEQPRDKRAFPSTDEAGRLAYGVLTEAIAACQRAGEVRAGDVQKLALAAWSTVHGAANLLIAGLLEGADAEGTAREVCGTLIAGMAPEGGAKKPRRPARRK